jgi:hypothetical protein
LERKPNYQDHKGHDVPDPPGLKIGMYRPGGTAALQSQWESRLGQYTAEPPMPPTRVFEGPGPLAWLGWYEHHEDDIVPDIEIDAWRLRGYTGPEDWRPPYLGDQWGERLDPWDGVTGMAITTDDLAYGWPDVMLWLFWRGAAWLLKTGQEITVDGACDAGWINRSTFYERWPLVARKVVKLFRKRKVTDDSLGLDLDGVAESGIVEPSYRCRVKRQRVKAAQLRPRTNFFSGIFPENDRFSEKTAD